MLKNRSLEKQERVVAWIMVTPALLVLALVAVYPVLRNFWLSLHDYTLLDLDATRFVGLGNYRKFLSDAAALDAIRFTLKFIATSVSIELVLGLGVALLMNREMKGRGLMRAAVLVPWAIPTSVSAVMWKFMLNDQFGFINGVLIQFGAIDKGIVWLGTSMSSFWSLVFTDVWKTMPFMALLLTAGLQTISRDLYEAAKIDGAGGGSVFFRVTLPLLRSTLMVTLLFRTLSAMNVFDIINVMTGGANRTESIAIYTYKNLMKFLDFGYGSTLAVCMFVISFTIAMIYYRVISQTQSN
jgi:ABC-type sugar transport system permease subunit